MRAMTPAELEQWQLARLNEMLATVLEHNEFYRRKLGGGPRQLTSLDELATLPYTSKSELVSAESGGLAANQTWPRERYVRMHRTSGTRGQPLIVLDTADDWQWWIDAWQFVLDAADISAEDRCLLAFSFGPFVGFWSAFDAVIARGALAIPTGGVSTAGRLELIQSLGATVVFCTPSYALRMSEVAQQTNIELDALGVKKIVVAGEPGGSIPATRERIEALWGAQVIDHAGASEVGPWGMADPQRRGLLINQWHHLAELISIESGQPARSGEVAELVLTTLGRVGCPVIRYRTGDIVCGTFTQRPDPRLLLEGGILGRNDEMVTVRGVNVYPPALESILRGFEEVVEYRITVNRPQAMDVLRVEIEDRRDQPQRVAAELHRRLGLRVEVASVPIGSLPRWEGKGQRFVDNRRST
jgi:phenylacetate-CoA ligase